MMHLILIFWACEADAMEMFFWEFRVGISQERVSDLASKEQFWLELEDVLAPSIRSRSSPILEAAIFKLKSLH